MWFIWDLTTVKTRQDRKPQSTKWLLVFHTSAMWTRHTELNWFRGLLGLLYVPCILYSSSLLLDLTTCLTCKHLKLVPSRENSCSPLCYSSTAPPPSCKGSRSPKPKQSCLHWLFLLTFSWPTEYFYNLSVSLTSHHSCADLAEIHYFNCTWLMIRHLQEKALFENVN